MNQTAVEALLLVIVAAILVIIFSCLYYLWNKTRKLELLARKASIPQPPSSGLGNICGYAGKELYEVLRDRKDTPELIEEIKESYIFYLSRHLEAVLEQGMIDRKKSRPSELEPEIAVGGTRGEILSWLPIEILSKFYLFGRSMNEQTDDNEGSAELKTKLNELVSEALLEIHMGAYVNRMSDLISRKYLRGLSNDEGA
ncbi:uncharacterized protein METZ01_LOCUS227947 [marine metagenome]|uniref:Uncharacterized protein n=1 Tax=marine metagenome TaxID=408172 RepID=A0A382GKE5_9ZZZZ